MKLRIVVDEDRLTVGDLIALESGKMAGIRDVFARLATDEAGNPLPVDEAKAQIDQLSLRELREYAEALNKAVKDAVPPAKGGNS